MANKRKGKNLKNEFSLESFSGKKVNYIVFIPIVVIVLAIVVSKTSVIREKFPLIVAGTFYEPNGNAEVLGASDYSGLKTIGSKKGVSMLLFDIIYTNHGEEGKVDKIYIDSLQDCTTSSCVKSIVGNLRGFWAEAFAGQTLPWSEENAIEVPAGSTQKWSTGKVCVDLNYCYAKGVYEGTHTYEVNIASIKDGGVKELVGGKYIVTYGEDPMGKLYVSISYGVNERCLLSGSTCVSSEDICCFGACNVTGNTTVGVCYG